MGTRELQFLTCKKPSIYGDDFLSHGTSVLSQYFHLVSTKCKMNKLLDIFIYLKHNKTNLKTPFKSQDGTNIINLTLSITFWPHLRFPSKFVLQHLFTPYFWCILILNILMYICNLLFLFLIYIENIWHRSYGCTFLLIYNFDRIIRYLGRSYRCHYKAGGLNCQNVRENRS